MAEGQKYQRRDGSRLLVVGACLSGLWAGYVQPKILVADNGSQLTTRTAAASAAEVRSSQERDRTRQKYSLADVVGLFNDRKGRPLYFAVRDVLVRIEYAAAGEQLYLYALTDPEIAVKTPRELSTKEPLIKKVSGNFDADLIIVSCGREFGDDECDQYSPIRTVPKFGREIRPADAEDFSRYLNAIGTLLTSKTGSTVSRE